MEPFVCAPRPWRIAKADEAVVEELAASTGLSRVTARILVGRGITTADQARGLFEPSLDTDWLDPEMIPGMAEAAASVASAVRAGKRIVVFGDFDLDGVSSAAIAALGLAAFGAEAIPVVPHRFHEGYGLGDVVIERIASLEPQLVITVDCGISSVADVARLTAMGIDVVVTDHHEPGDGVPVGVPVADPKLDVSCGSADLAGAGVALKLVHAVGALLGREGVWRDLVDLAALGTIADVVPLSGENRALVADGLARMRSSLRPGLAALAAAAGVSPDTISAESVAFALAPRLNAAGRMADPALALELLVTEDPHEAERLAALLEEHNRARQAIEADLTSAATAIAERTLTADDRVLVLAEEGWHEGVRGIAASRLAARFGLPVLLFSIEDGVATGSGRSVGDIDLFEAVNSCSDLLTRFGGHAAAVGMTLPASGLDELTSRLATHFAAMPAEAFERPVIIDALVDLGDLSQELAAEIKLLEPFGHGQPRPLLGVKRVFMNGRSRVGRDATHLKFTAHDGTHSLPAIAFRCPDIASAVEIDSAIDIAFQLDVDEWRGRTRLQMLVRDLRMRAPGEAPAAEFIAELFEHADETLVREEYAGIADADCFNTKLAGVTFEGRQEVVARLTAGVPLRVERVADNPHDANAIALIEPHGAQVGFLNRRLAAALAPVIDAGIAYDAEVTDVTGGDEGRSLGVNVLMSRRGAMEDSVAAEEMRAARREELGAMDPVGLRAELTRCFIGDRELHAAQVAALDHLEAGRSCLAVMATGRGKSLIFHLHAARRALVDAKASVFVFPLRALVADQSYHLDEAFSKVGLSVRTVTGESSQSSRNEVYSRLASGELDVVLTTPEFLDAHVDRFAASERIGFVVIDEAHHIGQSRAAHRPVYGRFDRVFERLGNPVVLAVTATAGSETAQAIQRVCGIEHVVEDPTVRENLVIVDARGCTTKDEYLAALAARGEKMIAYVNSRDASVRIARMLRKRVPEIAARTAFYNGGLARGSRHAVEGAFRKGDIDVVVATSAFGEGVNIPDVRHVALVHLPFNEVEFNQMSGRGGRDGAISRIHLLFGPKDARINEAILSSAAPDREDLATLWLVLRDLQVAGGAGFEVTNAELAERAAARRRGFRLDERGVSSAIGIFRELGLVTSEGYGPNRALTLADVDGKVDLAESVRYAEGLQEQEEFGEFKRWVLSAEPDRLLERFNRPILPSQSQ